MRSYGQYCGLAKALDVIGDRWSLLIVRELLIRGSRRYTDLREGLPGIATNLLADRIRELEEAGVISREAAPPPVATTLWQLTARGEQLRPVVQSLGRWGAPLLATAPESDAFRMHWLALPAMDWLRDRSPEKPPVRIELRTGDQCMTMETVDGGVRPCAGVAAPDAVISGAPRLILALLAGKLRLSDACAAGLRYEGKPGVLRRVQRAESNP